MNILFLYGSAINPERGGVQRVTAVLADEFARRGNGVFYLSLPKNRADSADAQRQFFLPNDNYASSENRAFLKEFLARERIDILVNQGGNGRDSSHLAYIAKAVGVPVVSVCHCGLIDSAKNYRAIHETAWKRKKLGWLLPLTDLRFVKKTFLALYKRKYQAHYRELCEKSDRVILLSESFKKEMAFYFDDGRCPETVRVISNPCSFPPPGKVPNPGEKRRELLFCGRIDFSQKRIDLMLEIWERVQNAFSDWNLTVVGGGVGLNAAKALARKKNLERLNFEGFQDPRAYYERAAIFCMTSAWETFGLVLVEAMNYGCVPVAFDSYAAARDIIDDGENGVLVPPMDCEKYAAALAELMRDPALRERLARAAFEKSKQLSVEKIGDKWLALFEELRASRNKNSSTK